MKKNVMMRLSALLLVAVLLTTCVISGTFAKYVTSNDGSETARVAKWGVNVTAPTADLFKTDYDGTVTSSNSDELVAPGTTSSLADFTITGTPEVDVQVTYSAVLTLTGWSIGNPAEEYCPLIFTVNSSKYYIGATVGGSEIEDVDDLVTAVQSAIAAVSASFEANNTITDTLQVSWAWEYESSTLGTYQTDLKDTKLGDLDSAPSVTLNVICTVTQVD